MKIIGYSSVDNLAVAKKNFQRAEQEMVLCFNETEKNYEYEFHGWWLVIWSKDDPEKQYKFNLQYCCKWQWIADLGIEFEYNNSKKILYFDKTLKGAIDLFGMKSLAK